MIDSELLKNIEMIFIKNKAIYIDNIHKTIKKIDGEKVQKKYNASLIFKSK